MIALVFSILIAVANASPSGLTPEEKAQHLLNRLSYGPRPQELQRLSKLGSPGIDRWIEEQLNAEKIDDRSLDSKLSRLPMTGLDTLQLISQYKDKNQLETELGVTKEALDRDGKSDLIEKFESRLIVHIIEQLQSQRLIRAVESRRQLEEVMFDFWFNHFNIDWLKGPVRWLAPSYEKEAIRKHMMGSFLELLSATAHHPAMLVYLDNYVSSSAQPNKNGKKPNGGLNENYARELMELHTLGVDGGYSQTDVTELARILTGWSVQNMQEDPAFVFKLNAHDTEPKHFLGHDFPGNAGIQEGEEALKLLASSPHTAQFISFQLAHYFVSDDPPAALVQRLKNVFLQTNGNLKAVYRALFKSPEFWSRQAFQSKVKRPLQFVASSIRALGGELDLKTTLPKVLTDLGEEPYKCSPPTGYHDDAETWVNPGALLSRLDFALKLSANRVDGVFVSLPNGVRASEDLKILVSEISHKILGHPLSKSSADIVIRDLSDESRTFANKELRPISLAKATALTLGSPEFQKR